MRTLQRYAASSTKEGSRSYWTEYSITLAEASGRFRMFFTTVRIHAIRTGSISTSVEIPATMMAFGTKAGKVTTNL